MWRAIFGLLLLTIVMAGLWTRHELLQPVSIEGDELRVVVQAGEAPGQVLRRLATSGHIRYSLPLRAWVRFQDASRVHVGEYVVPAGATARDLVDTLFSGRIAQASFTVVEGWNMRQLRAALRAEPRLRQQVAELDDAALMSLLGHPGLHPEGRFAPDTYFYSLGVSSDLDLLRRAFRTQEDRLAAAWASRIPDLPYRDSNELLIMASIVEKETGQPRERADIAGVFVRRMNIGMRLQTDPTVIYGLGDAYAGNITRAHLQQPTPYNTYTIARLPPTPIAMPGKAAIEAAANPADGTSLYFVGRGDGSHQFSATLDEHNRAVRQYQLQRRADYHSAPKPKP